MEQSDDGSNFAFPSMPKFPLFDRRIFLPWLSSATAMFILSYLWHGLALTDIDEMRMPLEHYFVLTAGGYLVIGLVISLAVRFCLLRDWITLKRGFPLACMFVGSVVGLIAYLLIFAMGLSFMGHEVQHVVVDALWQMFEQAMGGLLVSLGMIYSLHRSFMQAEHAR